MKYTSLIGGCLLSAVLILPSCKDANENGQADDEPAAAGGAVKPVDKPPFNADSAYVYIEKQCSFGPRTPGSAAQRQCADWMEQKLAAFCDTVYRQETTVKGGDVAKGKGVDLPCFNLIGSINPRAARRILLLTHWDSRPWADMDTKDKDKPVLAADDGGSGVGVLLELARALKSKPLPADLGVDIFFTDVEDYGKSEWGEASYALGTQYWARNPHVPGYRAEFGILLDMVGARDARFPMEQSSTQYAQGVQQMVYQAAARAGYSSFFPFRASNGGITDDHTFVNEMAKIPTIDIIHLSDNTPSGFPARWHTHNDNMAIIDRLTLRAVGETMLQVLFEQAAPNP